MIPLGPWSPSGAGVWIPKLQQHRPTFACLGGWLDCHKHTGWGNMYIRKGSCNCLIIKSWKGKEKTRCRFWNRKQGGWDLKGEVECGGSPTGTLHGGVLGDSSVPFFFNICLPLSFFCSANTSLTSPLLISSIAVIMTNNSCFSWCFSPWVLTMNQATVNHESTNENLQKWVSVSWECAHVSRCYRLWLNWQRELNYWCASKGLMWERN